MDLNSRDGFETRTGGRRAVGEDKQHFVLLFPVTGVANLKEATDRAIDSIPGAVGLSNVVLYNTSLWIPFIYGNAGYRVEGDPVFKKEAPR